MLFKLIYEYCRCVCVDMKLLLDLVINHSGHKHEWFQKSINRIDPYTDYYVWKDSKGFDNETLEEIPPNTWVHHFFIYIFMNTIKRNSF